MRYISSPALILAIVSLYRACLVFAPQPC
jgi:hypothetical protein